MKFNQVVWNALIYAAMNAYEVTRPAMIMALEQYAADCDGKVKLTFSWGRVRNAEFIPNPNSQY